MILNSSMVIPLKSYPTTRKGRGIVASVIKTNSKHFVDTDQLRPQLDQLHAEAEITRSKANNARLRLMRLAEAAENLQRRAATDVLVGKESEARELLIQKKKLMQALEKSKNRIEVLDKLSTKINEAISLKETQLIGNVTSYPEISQEELGHQIRFVSPKNDVHEDSNKTNVLDPDCIKSGEHHELQTRREADLPVDCEQPISEEENLPPDCEKPINEETESIVASMSDGIINSLKEASSYEEFLEEVDGQFRQVEADLVMFLRVSTLILDNEQKQMNSKVQQTSEILEDVRSIRGRIANFIKAKTE